MSTAARIMPSRAEQLERGVAWCHTCGRASLIDLEAALDGGLPTCCGGERMTLDSPAEHAARACNQE